MARVLVVDDYPDAASSSCELVRAMGHDCRFALDGQTALTIVSGFFEPDVVILDLGLPDISGFELAPRIREIAGERPIVIAALSGWAQPADLVRSADAGFDRHIAKPTSLAKLQAIISLAGLVRRA